MDSVLPSSQPLKCPTCGGVGLVFFTKPKAHLLDNRTEKVMMEQNQRFQEVCSACGGSGDYLDAMATRLSGECNPTQNLTKAALLATATSK